ncbi:MAG: flagellin lysine-N-methylase [Bacillus subtilis]|nr:flagellin lysine-N-methylase [Bacillus subtilis]
MTKTIQNHGSTSQTTLVPDYYKHFSCKGSSCRTTCCAGWSVTIPQPQYYRLLGMACPSPLREKLDRTFQPLLRPTPDRFAEIVHNYEGKCPLLMDNGLCSLHAFGGETLLPSVCRYYPRGPKRDYANEASCANSCERTLELLFESPEPIRFEPLELAFDMAILESEHTTEERSFYLRLRSTCFEILSNRSEALPTRILQIGKLLHELDRQSDVDFTRIDLTVPEVTPNFQQSLPKLMAIARWFFANNRSIAEYSLDQTHFESETDWISAYQSASRHVSDLVPLLDIKFEKMLVNHLFFRQFPFQEARASYADEFASMVGTYSFLRYLTVVMMRFKNSIEDFVDLMAKAFRVISHTRFEHNILVLLRNEEAADPVSLAQLVLI